MNIYDQHVHTDLSFDSIEKYDTYVAAAIEKGSTHFVSTEHLDIDCEVVGADLIPDFQRQIKQTEDLLSGEGITGLLGIEVGFKLSKVEILKEYISKYPFDVVLLSVHENEEYDVTSPHFIGNSSPDETYKKYLELCQIAVDNFTDYDIFTHIDFMLRYIGKVSIEKHKEALAQIFRVLIRNKKTLELNTRFIYRYNDTKYLYYIFSLYKDCGGERISLGSDAHQVRDYQGGFDIAKDLLKKIGFTEITVYQNRIEKMVNI